MAPCYSCAKLLVNAGLEEVYYADEYSDTRGIDLLRNLDVRVERYVNDLEPTS
jgi:dCMP deaminase